MNKVQNLVKKEQQDQNKRGRPSKYEPKTIQRLLSAMSDGLTVKQACRAAGIGETTLSRWKLEHFELMPQLEHAREQTRQDALASIKRAGETDWRAKKAFLELSFPEYRQPNTRVEVNTSAQAGEVQVVYTEEERRAMIEAREQFLKGRPDIATHAPDVPSGSPEVVTPQPKIQAGTPIGATHAPEDPRIAKAREFENGVPEDQTIVGTDRLGRF